MNKKIKFRVNGKRIETEVPTNRLLIDCLRYDLGLTGTKEGCSVGVCGACTVLMDGDMISSCLTLAVMADGHDITTVEGLAKNDTSGAQLGKWGQTFNEGVDRMRRLVCEYYGGFSFGGMVRQYPDLRGTLTDLLIGDLFHDRVDKVWGPLESLYEPGKQPIPRWDAGTPAEVAANKANELTLPDGRRP